MKTSIPWPAPGAALSLLSNAEFASRLDEMDSQFEQFVERTCELAQIPAPTFAEALRAKWVADQMRNIGLSDVRLDAEHNVLGCLPGEEPGIVIAAHSDTVFAEHDDHSTRRQDGRLMGPGVGDNAIGLAGILEVARSLQRHGGTPRAIWFAATVGEEGLGDLRGVRTIVDQLGDAVGAFVAVEGHFLGRICTVGVGSRRWRLTLRGAGGHSWHDFGKPSAVHGIGELIDRLARLKLPKRPRTTLNVGRVEGGEGVNVIARSATLELDLRSESQDQLESCAAKIESLVRDVAAGQGLDLETTVVGDRPAAHIARSHPLVATAAEALRSVDLQAQYEGASTDANYPGSLGIPSICVGVTRGGGMHTPEEWVEEAAARSGLRQLAVLAGVLSGVEA